MVASRRFISAFENLQAPCQRRGSLRPLNIFKSVPQFRRTVSADSVRGRPRTHCVNNRIKGTGWTRQRVIHSSGADELKGGLCPRASRLGATRFRCLNPKALITEPSVNRSKLLKGRENRLLHSPVSDAIPTAAIMGVIL